MLADKGLHGLQVIWQYGATFVSLKQIRKMYRQFERFSYTGFFHGVREFDRVGGAQDHHWNIQAATAFPGSFHADGRVWIQHFASLLVDFGNGFTGLDRKSVV